MKPEDIARAYHCPHALAEEIVKQESAFTRGVLLFGPIRCWWGKEKSGWMFDNQWVGRGSIAAKWRHAMRKRNG